MSTSAFCVFVSQKKTLKTLKNNENCSIYSCRNVWNSSSDDDMSDGNNIGFSKTIGEFF